MQIIQSITNEIIDFANNLKTQAEPKTKFYSVDINEKFNLKLDNISKLCEIKSTNKNKLNIEIFYSSRNSNQDINFVKEDMNYYFELNGQILSKAIIYIPYFYLDTLSIVSYKNLTLNLKNINANKVEINGNTKINIKDSDINYIDIKGNSILANFNNSVFNSVKSNTSSLKLNIYKSFVKYSTYNSDSATISNEISSNLFRYTSFTGNFNSGNINIKISNPRTSYKNFKITNFNGNVLLTCFRHKVKHSGYFEEIVTDRSSDVEKTCKIKINVTINNGNVTIT